MSQSLMEQIEEAIEKAADKHLREVNRNYSEIQQANMPNVLIGEGFDAGCAFILPLLKKAIEQRDWHISDHYQPYERTVSDNDNKELLKLLVGDK